MRRKARLADGTSPGLPVADSRSVIAALESEAPLDRSLERGHPGCSGPRIARVGLERDLCCSTFEQIGQGLGVTATAAWKLQGLHRRLMAEDEGYARRIAGLATTALANCHADRRGSATPNVLSTRGEEGRGIS